MQTRRSFSKAAVAGAVASAIASVLSAGRLMAAGPTTTVRLADQPGAEVDYAAVWIAEGLGYFEEEGIRIERRTYANGPAAMLDFPSGSIDAVMAAIVPFMQFAAGGGEFKLIMSLTKGNAPLVGLKKFKSYKDLDGQNIGSPGIGTVHDAVLGYVEETQGIKLRHVYGKITDFAVMTEKGEIDAFIGWEPASAAAIAQNPALHYIAQLPPLPHMESLGLVFQPKIAKENPDLIVRFVRATLRGIDVIKKSSKEKTAELIAKKMNDPKAIPVVINALGSVELTDPRLDMPSTRILLKTIAKQGKIPANLVTDVDGWMGKYLDYSFLDKAEGR
jgi:ABC-type nitrate/sulfonate/bicarbonate transport system substrate-binding protein